MRRVPGRKMLVVRRRRLVFSILWPLLRRIFLARSILFHALQRRVKRKDDGTKERRKSSRRLVSNSMLNDSRSSSQFPMVEEKAKGHLVSPSCCRRKRRLSSFKTSAKTCEKGGSKRDRKTRYVEERKSMAMWEKQVRKSSPRQ